MKKTLILTLALAFAGLCVPASAQEPVKDGIYVSDMRGVESGTIWGQIPYDLPVFIRQGGGGGGGDCPCPKYEKYIHWYTNMCSLALGKDTVVGRSGNSGTSELPEDQYSVVIGPQSKSFGYGNVVMGHMTLADDNRAVAVGKSARASGLSSIAIGDVARAETNTWGSIAIGCQSYAVSTGPLMSNGGVGWTKPIAIGLKAEAYDGLAIGHHSTATNGMYTIALGGGAVAKNDSIQIGYGLNERRRTCKIGNAYFVDVAGVSKHFLPGFRTSPNFEDFRANFVAYLEALTPYEDIVPSVTPAEYAEIPTTLGGRDVEVTTLAVKEDDKESIWNSFSKVLNAVQAFVLALIGIFWAKGKNKPEDKPEEPVEPQKRKRK